MPVPPIDAALLRREAESYEARAVVEPARTRGLRLVLSLIDLTTLEGGDTTQYVRALCRWARAPGPGVGLPPVAAVCVYPVFVATARAALIGSPVRVASVAGAFPAGQSPIDVRAAEVAAAVSAGADEIDFVINRGVFLAGRRRQVREEIRVLCHAAGAATVKVILETGELGDADVIREACDLVLDAASSARGAMTDGAVFLKTSTGKIAIGATMPSTLVLIAAIRDHVRATGVRVGLKPAGGIRTPDQALAYLVMVRETLGESWLRPELLRFGASSLARSIVASITRSEVPS
ncbi:MAG: deoxyribose-phosphate aldolase [Phycisphaerales bacterium]|nr:deoxyribose-phosphate aldolase [Phycisphaerales bacterium]